MPGIIEALISPQRHEVHKGFKNFFDAFIRVLCVFVVIN